MADFARLADQHLTIGSHHPGVLIALSSRFSRAPAGRRSITIAVAALLGQPLADRTVYLSGG